MTHRLSIRWPDPAPFAGRTGPIRILAVSDDLDPALEHPSNRDALSPIDLVVGCGDIDSGELCFVADAFGAPLVYVLGNHDRGARWAQSAGDLPSPLPTLSDELGLSIVGLSWPGHDSPGRHARRDAVTAWTQVLRLRLAVLARRLTRRPPSPALVVSHAPPEGLGDGPDAYHRGFEAYVWLLRWLHPPLWLHGHTHPASTDRRRTDAGDTTLFNVTGSVLVELRPPSELLPPSSRPSASRS